MGPRKATRVVERLQGMGKVTRADGTDVGPRRYNLTVYQEVLEVAGMQQTTEKIDGLTQIEGRVEVAEGEAFTLMDAGDLTLALEDGRTLPFGVQDMSGRIVALGSLK